MLDSSRRLKDGAAIVIRPMIILVFVTTLMACTATPSRTLTTTVPDYVTLTSGADPINPTQPSRIQREIGDADLIEWLEDKKGRALNILQISGGGQNGAFAVGVLKGWKDSGQMPQFDIVTGISVGALVSTFAFLGDAESLDLVSQVFTSITESDVARRKGTLSVVFGGDAFLDNSPLEALIERAVTDEVIDRVAAAYKEQGRYLFIGVLNLDYRQLWVFNMTALAASDEPDRYDTYRRLLLASSAVPLAFSPVEIGGHLYADGGARDRLLVAGLGNYVDEERRLERGRGNLYVLFNDQAKSAPAAAQRDLKSLAAASIGAMLDGQMETTILRSYVAALARGYGFHLLQIPADFSFEGDGLSFSPEDMQGLHQLGRSLGSSSDSWITAPEAGDTVGSGMIRTIELLLR